MRSQSPSQSLPQCWTSISGGGLDSRLQTPVQHCKPGGRGRGPRGGHRVLRGVSVVSIAIIYMYIGIFYCVRSYFARALSRVSLSFCLLSLPV
jgi:hypothetical protein